MQRLLGIAVAAIAALASCASAEEAAPTIPPTPPPPPLRKVAPGSQKNIIFLLTDDQDLRLGSMGAMPFTMEHITHAGANISNYFIHTPIVSFSLRFRAAPASACSVLLPSSAPRRAMSPELTIRACASAARRARRS